MNSKEENGTAKWGSGPSAIRGGGFVEKFSRVKIEKG